MSTKRKRPPTTGGFKAGNTAASGRGTRGSARPKTGRPLTKAKEALRDLLLSRGLRELAIDTLERAMKAQSRSGEISPTAIRACEMVLERTDPEAAKVQHGGEVTIKVVYE